MGKETRARDEYAACSRLTIIEGQIAVNLMMLQSYLVETDTYYGTLGGETEKIKKEAERTEANQPKTNPKKRKSKTKTPKNKQTTKQATRTPTDQTDQPKQQTQGQQTQKGNKTDETPNQRGKQGQSKPPDESSPRFSSCRMR